MKKLISLTLSLLLVSSLLAGCTTAPEDEEIRNSELEIRNEEESKPESDVEPEPEPEPEPDPTPDVEPEPELPPYGTKVGERFRDLTLTDINGNSVNTADFRGKIIIFNVWATWCPPCIGELPDFNEIASEYADDIVIIAAHTYDSGMYNMPSYVETNFPDTNIIFAYDTPHSDAYLAAGGTRYVPQTAIIDRDGVILYSDSGALSHSWLVEIIENNK